MSGPGFDIIVLTPTSYSSDAYSYSHSDSRSLGLLLIALAPSVMMENYKDDELVDGYLR
jgi:hypothetical protein